MNSYRFILWTTAVFGLGIIAGFMLAVAIGVC